MRFAKKTIIAALLASSGLPTFALAQDETAPPPESGFGGEIVVTAQKRAENLQEVPIAISAVSAEKVELLGITEVKDLSALAPNVAVLPGTTNATAAVISIRGIPTPADETQGFDSPIGLYIDGVYQARSSAASYEVADIERVEVLRGPQGTLFGRNTTGGAINIITKLPPEEASIQGKLGYGNFDQMLGKITLNTGDYDGFSLSLGYLHKQRDGVVDNLLEPDDDRDPGGNNIDSVRAAMTLEGYGPFTFTNIFDWTQIDGVPHANQLAQVGDGTFRPNVTIDGFTYAQVQPANVAGYLALATALDPGCGKPVSIQRLDEICLEQAGVSTDKLWGDMFRIEADLEGVDIRSTTAYRRWDNKIRGSDLDGLGRINGPLFNPATLFNGMPAGLLSFLVPNPIPSIGAANFIASQPVPTITQSLFQASNDRNQSQFSQEIEIVSDGEGSFEWVLGGFFFTESGSERNPQNFGFVLDTNQAVFTAASFGGLAPGFQAANPARFRIIPQTATLDYDAKGRSIAIYGQGTLRPGGPDAPFGITVGLRYTWDKKEVDRSQNGATPFTNPVEIALNQQEAKFSRPTGHVTLDYRASDEVNLYARAARGYRSGGFNLRQSTSVINNIPLIPFNEEVLNSFELGAKMELFDRLRLNSAVFYNIYKDQLATIPIPITGGGSFGTQVVNAGKTIYMGVEVEAQLQLNDTFSFDGSFGYVDKNVKRFPGTDITGVTRGLVSGESGIASVITPGNSPNYTANAALNANFPLGGETELTGRVGWTYIAEQYFFANPLTAPFNEAIKQKGHGRVDAQIRIDGIGIGEGTGLTFWGRNIFNKDHVARGIDFGQLGFGSVIYGDPRTYGVALDFEF